MAHIIASADEAVDTAGKLAAEFAAGAAARDRERRLPRQEIERLSESGLLGITVPGRFGGAEVDAGTVAEVVRLLATVDASIAQIPHSHVVFLDAVRRQGNPELQRELFAAVLDGGRIANAQSERTTATIAIAIDATTLSPTPAGYLLNGEKFYCTGALFADRLAVRATVAGTDRKAVAFVAADAPGVEIADDWDALGQRTTASGTVRLTGVAVPATAVLDYTAIFAGPSTYGARAQLLHAAIDAGIARGALDAAVAAAGRARPWFEAGVARAVDDPLLAQDVGELEVTVRAAEALLRAGAAAVDHAESTATAPDIERASIAVAAAKVAAARTAVQVSTALFEAGGTRSVAGPAELSRYWRDARTHTLHDPTRWKLQHIGRWVLTGTPPPRHGLL